MQPRWMAVPARAELTMPRLLHYIAGHVYDAGHSLAPAPLWVLDATPLMEFLAQEYRLDPKELGTAYDLTRFQVAWERLAQEGFCDAWDGMECQRVLLEWWRTDRVEIESFIRERANVGPDGL